MKCMTGRLPTCGIIRASRYSVDMKSEWDEFIWRSKNGMFLFCRDYLGYHADRFCDHSLLFYSDGDLLALLPANAEGDHLVSHGGVTFGGFITSSRMTTPLMLDTFEVLLHYLREQQFAKLVYKCIPYIYWSAPAEEDRYALFRYGARLVRRDVSSTIDSRGRPLFQERRSRSVKKAIKAGVTVREVVAFAPYWEILCKNLADRYNVKPVHSVSEIEYLRRTFAQNIRLFAAYREERMLAGVVVYESQYVAHAQYIAAGEEGKRCGALDMIFSFLINTQYPEKRYFDFGISTEQQGAFLNSGLIEHKEGFGARAVVHDFYELAI